MATTTRPRPSSDGNAGSTAAAKVRQASDSVTGAARGAKGPLLAAGSAAAGVAGGLALGATIGSRRRRMLGPRRRVLGVPVGRKSGLALTAEALGKVANELGSATGKASGAADDVRQIREQLDRTNRQSPIEVLLDALTHRRGAHKAES